MLQLKALKEMADELGEAEAETVYSVDLRYRGQSFHPESSLVIIGKSGGRIPSDASGAIWA